MNQYRRLSRNENQARGLARYAIDFLRGGLAKPAPEALRRVELFHADSVACAVAALGMGARAPRLLRHEALGYPALSGGRVFGSVLPVAAEKAVLANCAAARELDANGTNFGFNPRTGDCRGEFGHNDFYPVVVAAAQEVGLDGRAALLAMLCLDEIRGRLAEVFALKDHKIDHVLHGAIASAAVYGALRGGAVEQIESAIGLVVAHHVPFRAIRHGEQLSDSKGASAAISAEAAVLAARRALRGFVGPADVFRNPQAVFCLFEPPARAGESPFDLELALSGDDFAVMGMHFKLGVYEHQSASAIEGLLRVLSRHPEVLADPGQIVRARVRIYQPAFGIIGDPAKRDPRTRQSADHSLPYIVATVLRKAFAAGPRRPDLVSWSGLAPTPADYDDASLFDPLTRALMERIEFAHGGPEFDRLYPEGLPTEIEIEHARLGTLRSGRVLYPAGHARNVEADLPAALEHKFHRFAALGVKDTGWLRDALADLAAKSPDEILLLYATTLLGG